VGQAATLLPTVVSPWTLSDDGREVGQARGRTGWCRGAPPRSASPESGALQPDVGSACGDIIIEKASSENRRGHSPQTPRGETPQGGKQHTGKPTRQHFLLFYKYTRDYAQHTQKDTRISAAAAQRTRAAAAIGYIYIHIYICVCVYIYTHTHTHIYIYIYLYIYIYKYILKSALQLLLNH